MLLQEYLREQKEKYVFIALGKQSKRYDWKKNSQRQISANFLRRLFAFLLFFVIFF